MASRPGSGWRPRASARRSGRCRWRMRTGSRRAPRCRVRRWMGIHMKVSCGTPHALWGCARARVRTLAALPFLASKGLRGCRPAAGETGAAWSTPGWCGYHSEHRLDGAEGWLSRGDALESTCSSFPDRMRYRMQRMCILSSSVPQQLSFSGAAKFLCRFACVCCIRPVSACRGGAPAAARSQAQFLRRLVADPGRRRAAARR